VATHPRLNIYVKKHINTQPEIRRRQKYYSILS